MSLKVFHIFFICSAVVLSAFFGAWEYRRYQQSGMASEFALALSSAIVCAALILYVSWFIRKGSSGK